MDRDTRSDALRRSGLTKVLIPSIFLDKSYYTFGWVPASIVQSIAEASLLTKVFTYQQQARGVAVYVLTKLFW